MEASDVFIVKWPNSKLPWEFYRNMLPDVPLVLCHSCNHFFHEEDWEFEVMKKNACAFCRTEVDSNLGNGSVSHFPPPSEAPAGAPVRQNDTQALRFD